MAITYELGITSVTAIQFYPDWEYSNGDTMVKSKHRTRTGNLYQYKWNDYGKISFNATWVTSETKSIVNSWWSSQTKLLWFVNDGSTVDVSSVMLVNNEAPFKVNIKPYTEYWKGPIELEEYLG